ncbi:MAG: nucleotidyltransferase family protein [Oscillospiraceae bacterium]
MDLQFKNMLVAIKNAIHRTEIPLDNPDFDLIFKYAEKQSVLPIVYEGCSVDKRFGEYESSPKLMKKIYSVLSVQSQRTAAFEDIYVKLLENGVKPLVLKGLLCRSLYGELCDHRSSGDEDILIQVKDFDISKKILLDNGYELEDEYVAEKNLDKVQEVTFKNKSKRLTIELHLNFFSESNELLKTGNRYFDNIFENAVLFEVDGKKFYTLEYTQNYIYLFFHLFKHFISSGVGIRLVLDLLMFEKIYANNIDWAQVEKAMKDISAWSLYGDVTYIGNKYLGFEFQQRSKPVHSELLVGDMEQVGTFGNQSESQAKSAAFAASAFNNKKERTSFLNLLFPSLEVMKCGYPEVSDKKWMLPIAWIKRIIKYIPKLLKRSKRKEIINASKIAERRIKIFEKYGIIKGDI